MQQIHIHDQYSDITPKQEEILKLLLQFRHLNLCQIRLLLNHKSKSLVCDWVADLTERGFLNRTFEPQVNPKASQYCLDTAAIRYLKKNQVNEYLLKRFYTDKNHTHKFKEHCLFIADIYLSLRTLTSNGNTTLYFETKTQLHDVRYLILPHPDAYFWILEPNGRKKRYFLELFDDRIFIYRRVYQYLEYFDKKYWEYKTKKPFPDIIFICPDEDTKKSIRRFIESKISNDAPVFLLTTKKQIREQGICREILEKVAI